MIEDLVKMLGVFFVFGIWWLVAYLLRKAQEK